jgi:UDP-MurNAc hydroxylase
MKATSIGHAGILVETRQATIVCDPWFIPAFHGSWFVFPRNDRLPAEVMAKITNPDYLYISHQHADHLDEPWLRLNMNKDVPVLLPDYPTKELQRQLSGLGFHQFIQTRDTEEVDLGDGLSIAIHVESTITDGPGGDSALVISDGECRLVNQNDCRTGDLAALRKHGSIDMHWLQFSGAIWYPMVYEEPRERLKELARRKVESQFARAFTYVASLDARVVVPSAGPPCFLDDDLYAANWITGEEVSIFPDQTTFLERLQAAGRTGVMNIPGTIIDVSPTECTVTHPLSDVEAQRPFVDKESYLRQYQADWKPWLAELKASWPREHTDLVSSLKSWWEPLLALAPTLRGAIGGSCRIISESLDLLIDFDKGMIRPYAGEAFRYRFTIPRPLLELVVRDHAVDWSNSLFLSCRFQASREGEFNEHLYNFFKSLSVERMRRAEQEAMRRTTPEQVSEEIELGDYIVQRFCPHRQADLSEFGVVEGDHIVCTLHGWKFSAKDGSCLNADDRKLSVRPRSADSKR